MLLPVLLLLLSRYSKEAADYIPAARWDVGRCLVTELCVLQVTRAVLVELSDGAVSHEDTTRMAMRRICPRAELVVFHLQLL